MRIFTQQSVLIDGTLALALAPALTPDGVDSHPNFYRGVAIYPQVLARGLLVLADVTATRYFQYTPVSLRDPVLSAQGDRLRAECFSACNGVYARLDLLQSGFDGQIGYGTTNVDIGAELRQSLANIQKTDKLHMVIGQTGLTVSHVKKKQDNIYALNAKILERPVQMPNRWIRALGNAAEIHANMIPAFTLKGIHAQMFVASLPPATGKQQAGWLVSSPTGVKLNSRRSAHAVYISGLHRLTALKRVMTDIVSMTFYQLSDNESGSCMVEVSLPGARLTLSLTAEAWQGYSGEGALLESLAQPTQLDDAEIINRALQFDAVIYPAQMVKQWNIDSTRVNAALSLLAVSGKLGFDAYEGYYFHRELPHDPDRILKDNPRLRAAQKLVSVVKAVGKNSWLVQSGDSDYQVSRSVTNDIVDTKCTCTWYLNHQNKRGPCKHILAVQIKENIDEC